MDDRRKTLHIIIMKTHETLSTKKVPTGGRMKYSNDAITTSTVAAAIVEYSMR
jgi:hypothetical protein